MVKGRLKDFRGQGLLLVFVYLRAYWLAVHYSSMAGGYF